MPEQTRTLSPDLRELNTPPTVRPLAHGYRVARWDSPASLTEPCRTRMLTILRDLAARSFGADHSDYWHNRDEAGFFDRISCLALILDPDGIPVGWGGYHRRRFASRRALYLDAAGVVPAHRRFGLSSALMIHFLAREILTRPWSNTYVVLRTRHPAVYSGWHKGLGPARVHPRQDRPVPATIARIAADAAEWLGDGPRLDPRTLLVRDAYRMFEGRVYGVPPRSGDAELDAYFAEQVGPKDAVLMVVRMGALPLSRILLGRLWGGPSSTSAEERRGAAPRESTARATPTRARATGLIPGARP
ncbi:GNAT family N-acetyltransferase [Nocardiopsis sp. MG754419]|uniref:GNAT family N-acetyltransferase n=1 Tax=Nocardiopsis sp. MG754419 TaxID=2259865 RepID=UPI001BACB29B|nr:GNAT family N-acetyltransferase [Nocardiopsis sp. MG754419]MBR8744852.1 GNAT family N-acetyltransferase [Nocardiopsis sp. MG754419]